MSFKNNTTKYVIDKNKSKIYFKANVFYAEK